MGSQLNILYSSSTKLFCTLFCKSMVSMKLTPCIVVGLAIMTGIQGDTIMGMEGEENYMEKKIMNDLTHLLKDIPNFRVKRSSQCVSLQKESTKCMEDATIEYMTYMMGEEDSRPDFHARKTCNFVTAAAEDCVTKLMETCKPPGGDQAFIKAKDESIMNLLEVADEQDINFDPQKCPITKEYVDRKAGRNVSSGRNRSAGSGHSDSKSLAASLVLIFLSSAIVFGG